MSQITQLLDEIKARLLTITTPVSFAGKVVVVYDPNDLMDKVKGIKVFPAIGVVYEGMASAPEDGETKRGISAQPHFALILIEQDDSILNTSQKQYRAIDCLDAMRDQFLGTRSTNTQAYWQFLVEAAAELKSGMVCWVQRWTVPVNLRVTRLPA